MKKDNREGLIKGALRAIFGIAPVLPIDYEDTFQDPKDIQNFDTALSSVSTEASQLYRGNNGGGMPCPDTVCSGPGLRDNF